MLLKCLVLAINNIQKPKSKSLRYDVQIAKDQSINAY